MGNEDSLKDLLLLSWPELVGKIPEPPSRIKAAARLSSPNLQKKAAINRPIPVRTSISVQQGSLQMSQLITYTSAKNPNLPHINNSQKI